jgi:hypothetical protein
MAYEFCHELTSIFDTQLSKREGKRQMRKWMHTVRASALRCFDSFLTTLEKYFDDIANYFIDRHTSGFVEGFNNKLKVVAVTFERPHVQRISWLYGHALFAMKILSYEYREVPKSQMMSAFSPERGSKKRLEAGKTYCHSRTFQRVGFRTKQRRRPSHRLQQGLMQQFVLALSFAPPLATAAASSRSCAP